MEKYTLYIFKYIYINMLNTVKRRITVTEVNRESDL